MYAYGIVIELSVNDNSYQYQPANEFHVCLSMAY